MPFALRQNLYVNDDTVITVVRCNDDGLNMMHLRPLLEAPDRVLGVSAIFGKRCQLSAIAFSVLSRALVVNVPPYNLNVTRDDASRHERITRGRRLIQDELLLNPKFQKFSFKMDQIAVACHLEMSIRISHAVDMLSATNYDRDSLDALMSALGGEEILQRTNVKAVFSATSRSTLDPVERVALRAWAACRAATLPQKSLRFVTLNRIDTRAFPAEHLDALAMISRHADRLDALKPLSVKNDIREDFSVGNNVVNIVCGRFPTRIRRNSNQHIRLTVQGTDAPHQNRVVVGKAQRVDGRQVQINLNGPVLVNRIVSVTTFGKDKPTHAESSRQVVTLKTLQRDTDILSNPFFRAMWLPAEPLEWPESEERMDPVPVHFAGRLNTSQREAVELILSTEDHDRIVMIQGPPGTGKTTVIATAIISYNRANSCRGIWVAAQSNVAVKHIAEKLIKEDFRDFKILVSRDFHYDWHEHLYEELEARLIRSDHFGDAIEGTARRILDCKVILCTLSMFSHPHITVFFPIVPVEMIILDEASQIECGGYLPIFYRFHSKLSKLVFVGDGKQLPPFGQDDIDELRSVFEFTHLRTRATFLNIQYRMPHVIGNFISQNIYHGALHTHRSCSTHAKACRFVDVKGSEEKSGHSWINRAEARVVVKLAQVYESKRMSFRIITPYDAQRSHIEDLLKAAELHWGDKVFNVDSFQGNEEEHIIISVVRTRRPGFLQSQRRTNVMLTRCKKTMMVCSNRAFLLGTASRTLVGKLADSLSEGCWIDGDNV